MNKCLKLLTIGLLTSGFVVNNYAMEKEPSFIEEINEKDDSNSNNYQINQLDLIGAEQADTKPESVQIKLWE